MIERDFSICEYCHLSGADYPWPLQEDHIIARQHGGKSEPPNLASACANCNRHKGPNIAGIDPVTGNLARLFNPRSDSWEEHFHWLGAELAGRTPIA
jgi:5-methylcytosine-specific restriction endonuclease McrA